MRLIFTLIILLIFQFCYSQSWQPVGPGNQSNSTHGLLTWNGLLVDLGSFNNNPCDRVATWDGTSWSCLAGGVGIVARAGVVWDGKLVVVGDFWNNSQPCVGCNGVAVWDGVSWSPLGNGVNNDVLSCTVWNNELVIAGDFTQADGVPVSRIIKWNGTNWESVGPIGSFDNDIRTMVEFEGELWVGGDFNNVGGQGPLDGLVKYDPSIAGWVGGNSGVDLIGGVNETVRVLYVNPNDGNLYMGGEFPELIDGNAGVQDFNMSGIAMYDGSEWTSLGTGLNEYCRAIHEYNGDIVAGGYFTDAGGIPANKIAKWDGTNWIAMGQGFDGVGVDEYVKAATVWNGIFFAGGAYTQAEGNPMNYISQWFEPATAAPVAWMTTSSTSLCGSGCIDFIDNSTNAPTSWNWTFPGADITSSTAQDPGSICWSSPGTYTVSLQACNAIGCTTQNIDIEVESGATVSVNDASICSGNGPITLTANPSVTGGSYLWSSSGEVTESISVNPASTTTYDVTYSYLGCTSSATSTVTVVAGSGYNINEDVEVCENNTIVYPDGSTEIITSNTTYTSNLVSIAGCDSIIVTNVNMVSGITQSENLSVCENTVVTYPDGTTETIVSSTTHTSNLTSVSGCDSIIVTSVTMNSNYYFNESISICENGTVTYPDGSSEIITVNTVYTSNLTSNEGCDSIIVTNVFVDMNYSSTQDIEVCSGSDYTFPDGTVSTNILVDEIQVSFLTSISGCDSVVTSNIVVILMPDISTTESGNIISSNQTGAQYLWLNCNDGYSIITGESNQSYQPISGGSYAVEVNLNGCVDTSLCILNSLGLDEISANKFVVYPNPVEDFLFIQTTWEISDVMFEIMDTKGKVVLKGFFNNNKRIDISAIKEGAYSIRLDEGNLGTVRFIKQ